MTGVTVTVWAPFAQTVEAVVHGDRRALAQTPEPGYWAITLPHDTDYLLSVNGGEPRPDPRSARQPYGVHGASRTFDTSAFAWTDHAWPGREVLGGVMYELHVGTFTTAGTLDAAIERLDHLVDLGVDTVELMPLAPFPGERGWGYDGVSWFAVHEPYGGPAALQRFVDAAHARGLAVCLDVVHNHFGPAGTYVAEFGPYFTTKHHTPWGAAINLDDDHAEGVRAFIIDSALRWLRDFHLDALRLDAVHALVDTSERHLLADLSDAVADLERTLGRRLTLIAESDLNDVAMITPTADGGLGMDGQWTDDVHHALHSWLTGETFGYYVDFGSAETLAHAFERVFVHDGGHSTFRGTRWGRPVPDQVDRRRFVVFTQNHDQVGNRGLGDRPDERLPDGVVAGGAALMLLGPYTPMIFQGQEWGTRSRFQFFCDHEPELGALITAGRLREFAEHGWAEIYGPDAIIPDPQSPTTRAASTLDWGERHRTRHEAMLDWYRTLIRLRREHFPDAGTTPLHDGVDAGVSTQWGADWFALTHGPLTVVAAPRGPLSLTVAGELVAGFGEVTQTTTGTLSLGSSSVAVVRGKVSA